jgi:hypothetical protein
MFCFSAIAFESIEERHGRTKDLQRAKADFAAALLQSSTGLTRDRAGQQLPNLTEKGCS